MVTNAILCVCMGLDIWCYYAAVELPIRELQRTIG